nr:hypothetical protein B0A51_02107 [Rachicladosporium sp. CCFEE 5018]
MRRQTPIAQTLYAHLYPSPSPKDPSNFSTHLSQHLVPEVRLEVATFYGDLNSTEARYPGLNYCHPPHRARLARFKHHARLFRAFTELGLTYQEIQDFCCWEGTRWARERFERDEGVKVRDTTGEEIGAWVDWRDRDLVPEVKGGIERKTEVRVCVERGGEDAEMEDEGDVEDDDDDEGSEGSDETASPPEPNEEVQAREEHMDLIRNRRDTSISARILAAWEEGTALPPELEQYLKERSERNGHQVRDTDIFEFLRTRRRIGLDAVMTAVESGAAPEARSAVEVAATAA